jgi:hypothetical protein
MIYGDSHNIIMNIKMLFDSMFLRDGWFRNVSQGDTVRGVDVSALVRDPNSDNYFAGISGAQVWQSPYQEWVYESGITMNDSPYISGMVPPLQASGIYVNGTFFSQDTGVSGTNFFIDYINGRVIFDSTGAIPENSQVQADYSFRMVRVDTGENFDRKEIAYHAETELKDNPWSNNNELYPSGGMSTGSMPVVFLELGESDQRAYEMGNRSSIKDQPVFCHIYTYTLPERNSIMDLISSRWHIAMPMVDMNWAPLPLSGLYGTLSPDYIPYQTLLENVQHNGHNVISKHFYFNELRTRPIEPVGKLKRAVAEIQTEIINITPTGRIEPNPYV